MCWDDVRSKGTENKGAGEVVCEKKSLTVSQKHSFVCRLLVAKEAECGCYVGQCCDVTSAC